MFSLEVLLQTPNSASVSGENGKSLALDYDCLIRRDFFACETCLCRDISTFQRFTSLSFNNNNNTVYRTRKKHDE